MEMVRDVKGEEEDHPLKAWKKANRKLANSVEEWDRFGYQEQQNADISCEKGGI